jgi:hypothetical protein
MTPPLLDPGFKVATEDITRRTLHRIYWSGRDPLEASVGGANRYDCRAGLAPAQQFGVLYFAFDLETCWMETVVRANMVRPAGAPIGIPKGKLTGRWACEVEASDTITLARFADEPLIHLGDCASNIMGDSYARTSLWAELLHAHRSPSVDGIYFRSRFKSEQFCVALFDRAVISKGLKVHNERNVDPSSCAETASIARRYGIVPI